MIVVQMCHLLVLDVSVWTQPSNLFDSDVMFAGAFLLMMMMWGQKARKANLV